MSWFISQYKRQLNLKALKCKEKHLQDNYFKYERQKQQRKSALVRTDLSWLRCRGAMVPATFSALFYTGGVHPLAAAPSVFIRERRWSAELGKILHSRYLTANHPRNLIPPNKWVSRDEKNQHFCPSGSLHLFYCNMSFEWVDFLKKKWCTYEALNFWTTISQKWELPN